MKWKPYDKSITLFFLNYSQIDSNLFYSLCSDVDKRNKVSFSSESLFWLVVNGITQDARI